MNLSVIDRTGRWKIIVDTGELNNMVTWLSVTGTDRCSLFPREPKHWLTDMTDLDMKQDSDRSGGPTSHIVCSWLLWTLNQ
jgi:hypothetical protein